MKKLLFLLMMPILCFSQYEKTNQSNNNLNVTATYKPTAEVGEGIKYRGNGVFTIQKTDSEGWHGFNWLCEKAEKEIAELAKNYNCIYSIINKEKSKIQKFAVQAVTRAVINFKLKLPNGEPFQTESEKKSNTEAEYNNAKKKLLELKQFKEDGIITQEEYDKAAAPHKKILLGL